MKSNWCECPANAVVCRLTPSGKPAPWCKRANRMIEIEYGDIVLSVEGLDLDLATASLDGVVRPESRFAMLEDIDAALRLAAPIIRDETASQDEKDDFARDLLLWTALKKLTTV